MRYIITERQYKVLTENKEKILTLPGPEMFGGWEYMQEYLEKIGNPFYKISGDLDLGDIDIESLGKLVSVKGYLNLYGNDLKYLGELKYVGGDLNLRGTSVESLNNLERVEGDLDLFNSSVKDLGNLKYVGKDLDISLTPLSKKMTIEEIKNQVEVKGDVYDARARVQRIREI
jgi:hypothetical protein